MILKMIEYICPDCEIHQLDFEIVPKRECPQCKEIMNVEELAECL